MHTTEVYTPKVKQNLSLVTSQDHLITKRMYLVSLGTSVRKRMMRMSSEFYNKETLEVDLREANLRITELEALVKVQDIQLTNYGWDESIRNGGVQGMH